MPEAAQRTHVLLVLQGVLGFSNRCVGLHSSFETLLLCLQGIEECVFYYVWAGIAVEFGAPSLSLA